MALELSEPGSKRARQGHRTPWQIAADFAADGAVADAALWRNYCAGMRGAQMHHWSVGLRQAVRSAPEKTEQEIVDGERVPEDEIVAVLEPSAWLLIASGATSSALAVLEAAESAETPAQADRAIQCVVRATARGS
jgi:hypothetical protein